MRSIVILTVVLALCHAMLLVDGQTANCCKTVRLDSTGPLAESATAFIIGNYEYVADDAGGDFGMRGIYRCETNRMELYYKPPGNVFGSWYIGVGPDSFDNGAFHNGGEICPEDLESGWMFLDINSREWITDPEISVTCQ